MPTQRRSAAPPSSPPAPLQNRQLAPLIRGGIGEKEKEGECRGEEVGRGKQSLLQAEEDADYMCEREKGRVKGDMG